MKSAALESDRRSLWLSRSGIKRLPAVTLAFVLHIVLATAMVLAGCNAVPRTTGTPASSSQTESAIRFADPALEASVREAIRKPSGDMYAADLAELTVLQASAKGITDISGLEQASGLKVLDLSGNRISGISALTSLPHLTELHLDWNQISDIAPVASMIGLRKLSLDGNRVSDVTPLKALTGLTELSLGNNQVEDISPLKSLSGLLRLRLYDNRIADASPLASLTEPHRGVSGRQ